MNDAIKNVDDRISEFKKTEAWATRFDDIDNYEKNRDNNKDNSKNKRDIKRKIEKELLAPFESEKETLNS